MQTFNNFYFHFFDPQFRLIAALVFAVAFNMYATPVIVRIAKAKKLFDVPDERHNHSTAVPTLGGLGIYATILSVGMVFINTCGLNGGGVSNSLTSLPPIMAGFTLIFFIGMKDDLLNISPWKKLAVEILALFILIVIGDIRLCNLQGIFNIGELSYPLSVMLSLFAGIVIINSLNLIDGVDGLAASIVMLAAAVFGSYFLACNEWEFAILAFIILGAIIPFYFFNVYGGKNKIFMGDSGSLILGFAMTILVFRFNEMNTSPWAPVHFASGPAFSFAVLIIPMFDTLRVFAIRIFRGVSPFKADRRHIHHLLLELGFNHLQTTRILLLVNIAFIAFAYFFNSLGNTVLLIVMIVFAISLSSLAMWFRHRTYSLSVHQKEKNKHRINWVHKFEFNFFELF